jgi:nicotinic acid mononucleotide adenylyltransferase
MSDDAIGGALRDEWDARASTDASKLESTPAGTIFVQSIRPQPISSTVIRRTLAHGHTGVAEVRGLLPPAVLAYIDRNQLYRPRTDAT